ncbi:2-aminoethylphosphonate ABC transport system, ATP-binding protein component [Ancylobacter novellus DSM 506]|uniref:2-aminoethylphosphonate ABC transport system, ATP-binding protein component n=1 Tax=Ancylobacter novellus (strain ATCC 8093 / DSM 506 / JCM 20403 / CCM 1077 / IAM 12100 / NBRC 12443 / NCIMB 10456) TaxID=639283 RepID=D7AA10_ANCN5|nr:putative 2-aminoethylphosphonate ABC transporter ATP-binding protein [Ancylobacter novellus]ADH90797.1 2-aminoethylphosphonate ABC transport system, ATP-binding protein component [Ancylobacter novellus DSM 506]
MLDTSRTAMPLMRQGAGPANAAPFLRISGIDKRFGSFSALRNVSLDVEDGEFICFLGPSGCGKSTLLRIIAGLEQQNAGTIHSLGQDISNLPPAQRQFGILFQSYALFPNLNVRENIVYGLRNRRMRGAEIDSRLHELLELIDLKGSERKYPAQLSGGQQQRVALARAIAPAPRLLLLDEPLSALDAKVRVHLRQQIRDLQRRLGLTAIMVTHDQEEALSMADRVVAMRDGEVEQIGTPTEIYHTPRSLFVAGFVGKMNILPGRVAGGRLSIGSLNYAVPALYDTAENQGEVIACLRPEQMRLRPLNASEAGDALPAQVTHLEFLGSAWRVTLVVPALGDIEVTADLSSRDMADAPVAIGDRMGVVLPSERLVVFPASQTSQVREAVQ